MCTHRPFCTRGASLQALTRRLPAAQVPIIQDGDNVVNDSFAIAQYLERTYPDRPSLFGGPGGAAGLPVGPASPPFRTFLPAGLHVHASPCLVSFFCESGCSTSKLPTGV